MEKSVSRLYRGSVCRCGHLVTFTVGFPFCVPIYPSPIHPVGFFAIFDTQSCCTTPPGLLTMSTFGLSSLLLFTPLPSFRTQPTRGSHSRLPSRFFLSTHSKTPGTCKSLPFNSTHCEKGNNIERFQGISINRDRLQLILISIYHFSSYDASYPPPHTDLYVHGLYTPLRPSYPQRREDLAIMA